MGSVDSIECSFIKHEWKSCFVSATYVSKFSPVPFPTKGSQGEDDVKDSRVMRFASLGPRWTMVSFSVRPLHICSLEEES